LLRHRHLLLRHHHLLLRHHSCRDDDGVKATDGDASYLTPPGAVPGAISASVAVAKLIRKTSYSLAGKRSSSQACSIGLLHCKVCGCELAWQSIFEPNFGQPQCTSWSLIKYMHMTRLHYGPPGGTGGGSRRRTRNLHTGAYPCSLRINMAGKSC